MNLSFDDSECELIGVIIGDGHIHNKPPNYYVGITGHIKNSKEYFKVLSKMIHQVWGKKINAREGSGGLRIIIYSKNIVLRLTDFFDLPYNSGKCFKVKIPEKLINDWDNVKHVIRGIVDTDGSVFVSNKPGSPNYPSIEITTSSKLLADQIKTILSKHGFRVAKIWSYKSNKNNNIYKVPLNGRQNLKKWIDEIGFSNPNKMKVAIEALS